MFGALSAASEIALANADVIEASIFNVTEGFEQLSVNVSSIPAEKSFGGIQARPTEGARAAAVAGTIAVELLRSCPEALTLTAI